MKEYKDLNKKNYLEYFDDYISIHQGRINDFKVILDNDFGIDNTKIDYSIGSLDIIWGEIKDTLKMQGSENYSKHVPIWFSLEYFYLGDEEDGYFSEYAVNLIDMLHHYLIEIILMENKSAKLVPYYEKGARRLNIQYKPVIEGPVLPLYILTQIFVSISKLNDPEFDCDKPKLLSGVLLIVREHYFNNLSKK